MILINAEVFIKNLSIYHINSALFSVRNTREAIASFYTGYMVYGGLSVSCNSKTVSVSQFPDCNAEILTKMRQMRTVPVSHFWGLESEALTDAVAYVIDFFDFHGDDGQRIQYDAEDNAADNVDELIMQAT